MDDDEIRAYLKPRHDWKAIIGFALTAGASVWGATQWLNTRADQSLVERVRDEQVRLRIEQTIANGKIEAQSQSSARLEEGLKEVKAMLADVPKRRR